MGNGKMKTFKVLFCLGMGIFLLSSCVAIRDARIRENSKKNAKNTSKHPSKNTPPNSEKHESYASSSALLRKYEEIIGISIDQNSTPLYTFIDHWMGVPYCYGGKSMKCTDCSGFVMSLYKEVYQKDLPHIAQKQYDICTKVSRRNLKEGNLVFFDTEKGKSAISHVGVYLGNNKFVHASASKGVRIDDLEEEYYAKAYLGGGKL